MQGRVTIPPADTGTAPPGHDEAMAARTEAGAAAAAAGLSTVPPAAAAPTAPPAPAAPPAGAPAAPAPPTEATVLAKAGLTREQLATEFAAGGISEASYEKLAAQGIPKEMVDEYIAGRAAASQATATAYENDVIKATVGTPEKYAEVTGWAATALTKAEIAAFNAEVSSGDPARAQLAVAGLNARHAVANPAEPALLQENNTTTSAAQGYQSWAQVTADMKDPRYAKDAAFRNLVRDKLKASPPGLQRK